MKKIGKERWIETKFNKLEPETEGENMETENSLNTKKSNVGVGNRDQHKLETEDRSCKTEPKKMQGVENNLCGVCRRNFESQSELETHLVEHHVEGKFGCGICSRV